MEIEGAGCLVCARTQERGPQVGGSSGGGEEYNRQLCARDWMGMANETAVNHKEVPSNEPASQSSSTATSWSVPG
jgi:hypothetical protein